MFLTKFDLDASVYPEITQMMSRYSDAIVNMNLNSADGILTAYLGSRYNIAVELAKTGANRNEYLVTMAIDIAIYRLYTLQETIPAHRTKLYEQAIAMLTMIRDGKGALPGVDPAPVPDPLPVGQIGYGSNARRPTLLNTFFGPTQHT